jgi:CheY-like chemotaxis protein
VILGLAIQAKRKNLILNSNIDISTEEKVYGDAFQLRQVLINIINNAIKYTDKGSISVSASFNTIDQVTGILEIFIQDTGIGISEEQLPYIFEEYNTQNASSEVKQGSTGLGLSIVKRIVNYHKGEIKVNSVPGKGTSFTIKLPYDVFVEKEVTSKLIPTNAPFSKVLLVDNDPLNLKILNLLLVNENYIVTNSMNGAEAFERYKNSDFDLVITDISIPGLNGFELARKIRALPNSEKASVPIIAISGFEKNEESEQSGISAWLEKPFDTDELLLTVKEIGVDSSYVE